MIVEKKVVRERKKEKEWLMILMMEIGWRQCLDVEGEWRLSLL